MRKAWLAFCSTKKTVVPLAFTCSMILNICRIMIGAKPKEGSSSSKRRGRPISAREMASICCSPPERVPPVCLRLSAKMGKRLKTYSWSLAISSLSLRKKAPRSIFSCTVRSGKISRPSGTWLTPNFTISWGRKVCMGLSWKSTWPLRTWLMPQMDIRVVLFPAPLAPIRVTISPSLMVRVTSRKA